MCSQTNTHIPLSVELGGVQRGDSLLLLDLVVARSLGQQRQREEHHARLLCVDGQTQRGDVFLRQARGEEGGEERMRSEVGGINEQVQA